MRLTQRIAILHANDCAELLGTDRPRISDLRHGKLDRFSLETLIRFCARVSVSVELHLVDDRPSHRR